LPISKAKGADISCFFEAIIAFIPYYCPPRDAGYVYRASLEGLEPGPFIGLGFEAKLNKSATASYLSGLVVWKFSFEKLGRLAVEV
jgi:hypothetical protein